VALATALPRTPPLCPSPPLPSLRGPRSGALQVLATAPRWFKRRACAHHGALARFHRWSSCELKRAKQSRRR
jgi:hypothetical protein